MTATASFDSDVIQMNISEEMTETLVYARFLLCHEIDTMFVIRIKGRRWYGDGTSGVLNFNLDDMIHDVSEDVWHCIKFMFQDVCKHVYFYAQEQFDTCKQQCAESLCQSVSVLPFRGPVTTRISEFMRPKWFDYKHDDHSYDIGDDIDNDEGY